MDVFGLFYRLSLVESIDLIKHHKLERLEATPRPEPVVKLGLVEANDPFRQRNVVGITSAADGWIDAGLSQAIRELDRCVLHSAIGVTGVASATLQADGRATLARAFRARRQSAP